MKIDKKHNRVFMTYAIPIILISITSYSIYAFLPEATISTLGEEDHLIEYLTAFFFLLAGIFFLLAFLTKKTFFYYYWLS